MRASRFVGGGNVGLRDEFSDRDADEDEHCAECGTEAEAFAGDEEGRNPGKYRLKREQERGVRRGQDGLGPTLNGECGGGGEHSGDDQCGDESRREVDMRPLNERETDGHEEGAESNLEDG